MTRDQLFQAEAYAYHLPQELIAQHPVSPRDSSRLMVINRSDQSIAEVPFSELPKLLEKGDRLIFNDAKVFPARLLGKRTTGGAADLLLSEKLEEGTWKALGRPAKKLRPGSKIIFSETFSCEVVENCGEGELIVRFSYTGDFYEQLQLYGQMPLPPYIRDGVEEPEDRVRYQTVYAQEPTAIAAPTAGLHFTEAVFDQLKTKGIHNTTVTLDVGIGTFRPVQADDIRNHRMHHEKFRITENAAAELNQKEGRRICVGTTSLRTVESATRESDVIQPGEYATDIFIYPGFQFRYADALLTNFHLPKSTLLMLVSAFAGYELTMKAYKKAVDDRFRFFSYGDAMLIL